MIGEIGVTTNGVAADETILLAGPGENVVRIVPVQLGWWWRWLPRTGVNRYPNSRLTKWESSSGSSSDSQM